MILIAVLLFIATALGASIPAVPQNEAHIDTFIATHGRPLFEDFTRTSMAAKTGRPVHTISDQTVASTANSMLSRLDQKSGAEKVKYLTGMQKKIDLLKAAWK